VNRALGVELAETPGGRLRIWDDPKPDIRYVAGADVAENKVRDRALTKGKPGSFRDRPDYSAIVVIEQDSAQHVASWHGYIDPTEFAIVLAAVGIHYNHALLVPEINSAGVAVVESLSKVIQYQPLYRNRMFNKVELDPMGTEWGWRTTDMSRSLLIAQIQAAVNNGYLFTRDQGLIDEIRQMQYDEQGKARGIGRDKDDRVFALGLALMGRNDSLSGRLGVASEKPESKLSLDDQITWSRVKRFQERIRSARSGSHGRSGIPRLRPFPRVT
jgi:hypothetical protein